MTSFKFRTLTAAAALAAALAVQPLAAAQAEEVSVPDISTLGNGQGATVDFSHGPFRNVVGGGALTATSNGENDSATYYDPSFAQRPRQGMVPVTVGGGENSEILWVPAGTSQRVLAQLGTDGSMPAWAVAPGQPVAAYASAAH